MKAEFVKQYGGVLVPASDAEAEKMTKFKTGEMYTIDIKTSRNPAFHRKVFAFFNFCYEYHHEGNEFHDEAKQREEFRKDLTILSGYFYSVYGIDDSVRVRAQSLSYGSMSPEQFSSAYHALVQAAMKHIFKTVDQNTENKLMSFF